MYSSTPRSSWTTAVTCSASRADASRHALADDRQLLLERRVLDPLIQAAPLQRVVDLARAVRREDHQRRLGRAHGAELGNRDLELGEQLEQIALELFVGAIDLVDQQHRRPRARGIDRLQQRPLDQERLAVELAPRAVAIERAGRVEDAQLEQLARVVPLVDGVADVEPFVALQANQVGVERGGDGGGQRGLADAGLALEKQRPLQSQRQKQRDGQAAVGDVVLVGEALLEIGNGAGKNGVTSARKRIAAEYNRSARSEDRALPIIDKSGRTYAASG